MGFGGWAKPAAARIVPVPEVNGCAERGGGGAVGVALLVKAEADRIVSSVAPTSVGVGREIITWGAGAGAGFPRTGRGTGARPSLEK